MGFESLRHIVSRAVSNAGSKDMQIARVSNAFLSVVSVLWSPEQAALVRFVSFHEGMLKCETTSPAAKQQFGLDLIRMKNETNRQLGTEIVKKILIVTKGY